MADLIELDEYKEYKGIKSTDRDGKLQSLIVRVSALIQNYCNRDFTAYSSVGNPKVEWFDAKTNAVWLSEFPVISVISVTTSTDGGITQTALTEAASDRSGYFVDLENGIIHTQQVDYNFLNLYDTPYRSLEVTYTAGYTTDTLPEDLKLATLDLVHYYEKDESVPTKTLLGGTIENALPYIATSLPAHIRRVLDLYRYSPG